MIVPRTNELKAQTDKLVSAGFSDQEVNDWLIKEGKVSITKVELDRTFREVPGALRNLEDEFSHWRNMTVCPFPIAFLTWLLGSFVFYGRIRWIN